MREVTLVFPVLSTRVLLGLKKDGFGHGRFAGFGGGLEASETPAQAAVRELFEECGLEAQPEELEPAGLIEFGFPSKSSWNQRVHVFLLRSWSGEPSESDEMRPVWFEREDLPFSQMWDDARYWLPRVLEGQVLQARYVFGSDNETVLRFEDALA